MKFYIGLGGIGCKALQNYSDSIDENKDKEFFYVDSAQTADACRRKDDYYLVSGISCGTAMMRHIGRNSMIYELFTGNADRYFSKLRTAKNVELVFVVSSFGGFGSAAIFPLMDYLESLTWKELKSCEVIAFNENAYKWNDGFPRKMIDQFELNTLAFVNELLVREDPISHTDYNFHKVFNPSCSSFLIDTTNIAIRDFGKYIDSEKQCLNQLDCKKNYRVMSQASGKPVFISYSSTDQEIADMIVGELMRYNIEPWIASKDMVEGSYPKQIMTLAKMLSTPTMSKMRSIERSIE